MKELNIEVTTEKDLPEVVKKVFNAFPDKNKFAFFGELGSGKTTLIKEFASFLGISQPVDSPTFTIMNVYEGPPVFVHFDLYRIEDPDEVYELGYEEYFFGDDFVFIEWAEKISGLLPGHFIKIFIEVMPGTEKRKIKVGEFELNS